MEITAQIIEGIKYKPLLKCHLTKTDAENFDVNSAKASCLIRVGQNRFSLSKWVSPKRTRSYPYERVYNTFSASKRITVIPVVKDEGESGDRDFLQWDTVSLMSLLDVYVILAYYERAEKHPSRAGKITNQRFDNDFVLKKLSDISNYHSSALHWNLKELNNIAEVLSRAKEAYRNISVSTQVKFHRESGFDLFASSIGKGLEEFIESSRLKAQSAQIREFLTVQPKEILATQTKAKITITNFLGGKYYFTVDETLLTGEKLLLIESKHSRSSKLPSTGDIKDGLLKMMLYTNLENVSVDGKSYTSFPVLRLTSPALAGEISSDSEAETQAVFIRVNGFSKRQRDFLQSLFAEAQENNFRVILGKG